MVTGGVWKPIEGTVPFIKTEEAPPTMQLYYLLREIGELS